MGKSVKFTTSNSRPRMENVGEGWCCYVGSLGPVSLEGYEYFKEKNEAAEELKTILSRATSELRPRHNLRINVYQLIAAEIGA